MVYFGEVGCTEGTGSTVQLCLQDIMHAPPWTAILFGSNDKSGVTMQVNDVFLFNAHMCNNTNNNTQ